MFAILREGKHKYRVMSASTFEEGVLLIQYHDTLFQAKTLKECVKWIHEKRMPPKKD